MEMDIFSKLVMGLGVSVEPFNLLIAVFGLVLGVIVGVLPGLGGANGCAILIPITFVMPPVSAVILLTCLYWGALYGGAICSILFNIPGEPWAVAVTFDGYPLAKKGRAGLALCLSFFAHFVGAIIGTAILTFLAPVIAAFALRFGPPETFGVMLLTFSAMVGLGGKSPLKTLVAAAFGFIMAAGGDRHHQRRDADGLRHHGPHGRVQLHRRGDRPVRHRRDPADRRRGAEGRGVQGHREVGGHRGHPSRPSPATRAWCCRAPSSGAGWVSCRAERRRPRSWPTALPRRAPARRWTSTARAMWRASWRRRRRRTARAPARCCR
jgi:hypothetical protein